MSVSSPRGGHRRGARRIEKGGQRAETKCRTAAFGEPTRHRPANDSFGRSRRHGVQPTRGIVMPNHWHFVVRPTADDQVSEFFRRLTVMHTMRWHATLQNRRDRASVSGTIQVVPDPKRWPSADGLEVRGAKPGSCQLHRPGRRLAVGFRTRPSAVRHGTPLVIHSERSTPSMNLAIMGEPARDRSRNQSPAILHSPRSALRR